MMSEPEIPHVTNDQLMELMRIACDPADASDAGSDHPGLQLAGRHGYTPVARLGEGGLSEVWRGIDANTGRDVAIKVPKVGVRAGVSLLQREVDALSRFHDPAIVGLIRQSFPTTPAPGTKTRSSPGNYATVDDLGDDGGRTSSDEARSIRDTSVEEDAAACYLVLEFIEGLTLEEAAASDPQASIAAFTGVCRVVQRVHSLGMAHNDLKPSNIMLRPDGTVVLLDFALCSPIGGELNALAQLTLRGGTEHFLAPELRQSEHHETYESDESKPAQLPGVPGIPGVGSDVFSLGVTLRWLAEQQEDAVSSGLFAVADRAADSDPTRRFDTATQLADAFERVLSDRSGRWPRRVMAGVGLGLVVAAGLATFSEKGGDPPPQTTMASPQQANRAETTEIPKSALDIFPGPGVGGGGLFEPVVNALDAGQAERATTLLESIGDEDRGWEWRLLWADATRPPAVQTVVFENPGLAAAFDREGGSALVAGADGVLHRVHPSGRDDRLVGFDNVVLHVAPLPEGAYVLADGEGRMKIGRGSAWTMDTAVSDRQLSLCWAGHNQSVYGWSHAARFIHRMDLASGEVTRVGEAGYLLIPPSAPGWRLQMSVEQTALEGEAERTSVLLDPNGTARLEVRLKGLEVALSIDVDPATGHAAVGTSAGRVLIYNATDEPSHSVVVAQDMPVTSLALAPDEKRLFVAGKELTVLDWPSGRPVLNLPIDMPGFVRDIDWRQDAGTLTLVSDQGLTQWKAPTADKLVLR